MRADFIGKFHEHLLGTFFAEPDDLREIREVARTDSSLKRLARRSAQYRERRLRAHTRDRENKFEKVTVGREGEAVELETVLFKCQMRCKRRLATDRESAWGAHAHFNTETRDLDNGARETC